MNQVNTSEEEGTKGKWWQKLQVIYNVSPGHRADGEHKEFYVQMLLSFTKAPRVYWLTDHIMRQKEAGAVGDAQILLQQPSEGSTLPNVEDQGKLPKIHDISVRIWRMLYTDPRWQRHTKRWQHELEQQQETGWWMWGIISSLVMPEQQIWSQRVRHNLERPKSCLEGCDFIPRVWGSLKGLHAVQRQGQCCTFTSSLWILRGLAEVFF